MIVGVLQANFTLPSSKSTPEVRVLSSTGITRLQQSYYPVRLPPVPPPEATLGPLPSHQTGLPRLPVGGALMHFFGPLQSHKRHREARE
jgi:hypothetical protein